MKTRRRMYSLVLAAGLLGGERASRAEPTADLTEAAEKVLTEAATAADKKDWAVCRTKAAGIWDKIKHPTVAALLGSCEAELGMNREAAEHLDFFLARDTAKSPNQTKAAKDRFPKVRAKVALITVDAGTSDATVWLDGEFRGPSPARLFVDPGQHKVEVRREHFVTKSEDVSATAGGTVPLTENLEPEPQLGTGGAGGAPMSTSTTSSGTSSGTGGGVDSGSKPIWPFAVAGVTAGAGLALGIAGIVVSRAKVSDAIALGRCTSAACNQSGDSDYRAANTWQGVGAAGFALAGASAIALIVYGVVAPSHKTTAIAPVPTVGPRSGAMTVMGSF